jgi:aspartyl aminopeptidase
MTTSEISTFIDASPTSFHAAVEITRRLEEHGFRRLSLGGDWSVQTGDSVYVESAGTVVAARIGSTSPVDSGVVMVAAHTDSPGLQLKARAAVWAEGLLQIPVEVYGGPILATWLDRDLRIAGRLVVATPGEGTRTVGVVTPEPVAIIPNLTIHYNREVNDKLSYNRQDHLKALVPVGGSSAEHSSPGTTGNAGDEGDPQRALLNLVARAAGVPVENILEEELFLVPATASAHVGELLVSPRIDNLAGCFTVLAALLSAAAEEAVSHTQMGVFFNHEEIGSATSVGAAGGLLESVLRRLVIAITGAPNDLDRILARSILISNDAAHARHPNYADRHDPGYAPRLGGGPVLKRSAVWRYIGDIDAAGWFAGVSREAEVPLQHLQNRSDLPAGSTIGPAVATRLGIRGLDVGIPMLAMHSSRETAATGDIALMITVLTHAYTRNNDEILDPDSSR